MSDDWEDLVRDLLPLVPALSDAVQGGCPLVDKWISDAHQLRGGHYCSVGPYFGWSLFDLIVHLNDDHELPREGIADWLDTLDVDLELRIPETVTIPTRRDLGVHENE